MSALMTSRISAATLGLTPPRDLASLIALYKEMREQVKKLSTEREQIMKTLAGVREEIGERLSTDGLCLLGGMVLLPKGECTPEQLEQAMKREVQS